MSRNLDRMVQDRTTALEALTRLDLPAMTELERRSRYKATSDFPRSNGPRAKGGHSDPTLSHVIAVLSGANNMDPIFDAVKRIATLLADIAMMTQHIEDERRFVASSGDKPPKERTAVCQACHREVMCTASDRCKAGYCPACYKDWTRKGRPYRLQFEIDRRAAILQKSA